jgi:Transposase DDE domain
VRYMEDPRQAELFDGFQSILSPLAYSRLQHGWQHLFRCAILKLLPAKALGEHFHPAMGRPTKELYSMAGLLFIMEFRDWTHEQATDAYMFNVDLQYALNLKPENQSLCRRTLERYILLFRQDELAQEVMHDVTAELVKLLDLDVSKQRLDSTHIESNMAKFGRIRLMATAVRRFLVQLKRYDEQSYSQISEGFRKRYEAAPQAIFGWNKLDDDGVNELRQGIAEDLAYLVETFRRDNVPRVRAAYQMMVKIFEQQCEVVGERVAVRKHPGGEIVCNPSDPEATLDGHKGSGYQVQLSETCGADNEVQLIVSAIPETACQTDSAALAVVIDDLKTSGFKPSELLADTAYGGDENHSRCLAEEIDLITPTPGKCPANQVDSERFTVADFTVEPGVKTGPWGREIPDPQCVACPAGLEPVRSFYDDSTQQIEILQFPVVCNACPLRDRCPTRDASGWKIVTISLKQVRLINRRRRERTEEFQGKYRKRSGIESTNSLVKRVTGLARLRVRGRKSVFMSIYLKVAGWNVLRAAAVRSLIKKLKKSGETASFAQCSGILNLSTHVQPVATAA